MKYLSLIGVIVALFGIHGCMEKNIQKKDLLGAWEIISAERNGKSTETLNGAYFEFDESDFLTTNLLGREESTPFEYDVEKEMILQRGNTNLQFQVGQISGEELDLSTSIREIPFNIKLKRIR